MKTNKFFKLFPFAGLVFISLTCEKESAVLPKMNSQEVYFEVSYINFAWGEQASVIYVKSDGSVNFQNGKPKFNSFDLKGQLTEAELKENLALAQTTKKMIPIAELSKFTVLIPSLTKTNFSKRTSGGADRGSYVYTAYSYSDTEKVYKAIKLAEDGDFISSNLDPNAKIITAWLKSIQEEITTK